jgi:hypothetical protein
MVTDCSSRVDAELVSTSESRNQGAKQSGLIPAAAQRWTSALVLFETIILRSDATLTEEQRATARRIRMRLAAYGWYVRRTAPRR